MNAVGPPAILASLKPLNNSIQLPLHVLCIVSNNYTAIGSGLYIYYKNTLFTYILAPIRPYVPAVLYTSVGCACRVKLWMTKGVIFFFPYRTAIRSGLTYIYWAQYVCTCSTRPYTMHGWLCLPCGIANDKSELSSTV